ncbi:MAG: hypothetical protein RBU25_19700 [Lentisphaeria bacterium]|jgi:hypothetical protein|nr:hypothetical protein [Lentisphaeria bacterium]
MKSYLFSVLVIVFGLAFVGCGKKEEPVAKPETSGDVGKTEIQRTVDQATQAVNETVEQATAKFDGIVAAIKENLAANKFEQALAGLKEGLALPNLSGEQKGILQQLQEAVQAAMAKNAAATATENVQGAAGEATKKVDGLLKGFGK